MVVRVLKIVALLVCTAMTQNRQVILNEILLADGDAAVELHNRTDQQIDLSNWWLSTGSRIWRLPVGIQLSPHAYLVVGNIAKADVPQKISLGLTKTIPNTLTLYDANDAVQDQLVDFLPADFPASLSLTAPTLACSDVMFWKTDRATLGSANFWVEKPVEQPLRLMDLQWQNNDEFVATFNQPIRLLHDWHSSGATVKAQYWSKKIPVRTLGWNQQAVYRLHWEELQTCWRSSEAFTFEYAKGGNTLATLYLNELLLYAPVSFVEVYNGGTAPLALGRVALRYKQKTYPLPDRVILPDEYQVLVKNKPSFLAIFPQIPPHRVIELASWPVWSQSELLELFGDGVLLDSVWYSKALYGHFFDPGISLEKTHPVQANWQPAQLQLKSTPTQQNSVFLAAVGIGWHVSPLIFNPQSLGEDRQVTLQMRVNTPAQGSVQVFSADGSLVYTLLEHQHMLGDYTLSWQGQMQQGNLAAVGQYILVGQLYSPEKGWQIQKKVITLGSY